MPQINRSPITFGSHLVEMTSAVSSGRDRKDGTAKLVETPPTPGHSTETTGRSASSKPYPPSMASVPPLSFSPASTTTSLFSVSIPHTSSPLAHHDSSPQRTTHTATDTAPTRSPSMRGLRAIFKRTSAGLTNGQRQRAESLKELIGEPRVLSLGSISISHLRDAGVHGGTVPTGPMDAAENTGDLAWETTAK